LDLLEKKAEGEPLPEPQENEGGEVVDLMDALRQSVAQTKRRQKPRKRAGRTTAAHKTGAKRKAS
jgi:non-homologous end joining protein Ku